MRERRVSKLVPDWLGWCYSICMWIQLAIAVPELVANTPLYISKQITCSTVIVVNLWGKCMFMWFFDSAYTVLILQLIYLMKILYHWTRVNLQTISKMQIPNLQAVSILKHRIVLFVAIILSLQFFSLYTSVSELTLLKFTQWVLFSLSTLIKREKMT